MTTWWTFLKSVLDRLSLELGLVLLSVLVLVRQLLVTVVKRFEKGKPVHVRILGKEFIEIKSIKEDELLEQQVKDMIALLRGLDTQRMDSLTLLCEVERRGLLKNQALDAHTDRKEEDIRKWS